MTSSLEEFFGTTLVINLDRRPDRLALAEAELGQLHFDTFERVAGIDTPEDGYIGSGETHRLIWRRIAAGEFGLRALIFEDDFTTLGAADLREAGYKPADPTMRIFMSAPWRPIFDALPHLSISERFDYLAPFIPADWDVLYLGGGYAAPPERVNEHVLRSRGMLGVFAYAMTKTAARAITRALDDRLGAAPAGAADMAINTFANAQAHYVLSPRLFIEAPGVLNDNCREVRDFPHSLVDSSHEQALR